MRPTRRAATASPSSTPIPLDRFVRLVVCSLLGRGHLSIIFAVMAESALVEHTLSVLQLAHVYTLPPRSSAGGWHCQEWPKTNHIFSGRVHIVALGDQCKIKLIDPEKGTLFAECPLNNDNPTLSVEPVVDSSRYFVLRVSDGSGRHAFLGMGFLERDHAFEFNVTLQDHVKRLRNEKEAEKLASAPAPPPQDLSLKGSVSIALPGGASAPAKPRAPAPAPAGGGSAGLMALAPPPPPTTAPTRGRRPVASATAPAAAPTAAATSAAVPSTGPSATDPFSGLDAFASSGDPFANSNDPFANSGDPFASSGDPFAAASTLPSAPPPPAAPFGDPFGASPSAAFGDSVVTAPVTKGNESSVDALASAFGDTQPFGGGSASSSGGGDWATFG